MSSRRRWTITVGLLSCWIVICTIYANEPAGPKLFPNGPAAVNDTTQLTRTGARRTLVVSAVDRTKGAVVNIHSERQVPANTTENFPASAQNRVNGMGTGIIIDPRGYIVTNHHVVEDVSALRIRLADGTSTNAVVVARHPELDLALIKIDPPFALPVMPIGTASDLMIGETVIAIGNAYGYEHTVSVGVISAVKRDVSLTKDMAYKSLIQTDASINPGNSGGPLININGELIGVNVAIRAGAQGIGFAIPVDHMVRSVCDMLKLSRKNYHGLAHRDVLQPAKDGLTRKVIVDRIDTASPAEVAGLNSGDVILQVGDVKVLCGIDVERGLIDHKPGEPVSFVVRRNDQDKVIKLALAGSPGDRQVRPVSSTADVVWQRLGVQFVPVARDAVVRFNNQLHGGLEVSAINNAGLAAKAGLKKGDILVGLHSWETVNLDNITYVLNHPDLSTFNPVPFFILRGNKIHHGTLPVTP